MDILLALVILIGLPIGWFAVGFGREYALLPIVCRQQCVFSPLALFTLPILFSYIWLVFRLLRAVYCNGADLRTIVMIMLGLIAATMFPLVYVSIIASLFGPLGYFDLYLNMFGASAPLWPFTASSLFTILTVALLWANASRIPDESV
ncbi:MAG: hypothetical protein ABL909_05065 [Sphingopyxis sp.]